MPFPFSVVSTIPGEPATAAWTVTLHGGLTVLLGPNGSGKTQLLRGLRQNIAPHAAGRKVRFISAGRIGSIENFRSDFDGHRGGQPSYDSASFGSKGDADRRHKIETLNGDFQTLAQRADILVKIQERLKKLFRRTLLIDWDAGSLTVKFARLEPGAKPYSSGREASGLLHLVGILTALYDDEIGVLLLDEPEVSLHPQLQAFLAKEISQVAGDPAQGPTKKIVIIATHSTELFQITKPMDLISLVFCNDSSEVPIQIDPSAGELNNKKVKALVARLGQEHKLSLFASRPLLVEGPSDAIICTAIASKLDRHIEAAGSQLLPVVGKGQMPVVRKLLKMFGKNPILLVDADAVADGMDLMNEVLTANPDADCMAQSKGAGNAQELAKSIFSHFCNLIADHWEEIRIDAERHPYWLNKEDQVELAMRRAAFCTILTSSEEHLKALDDSGKWAAMKLRLLVLLDLLEMARCFVLRRGSIESYYQNSDPATSVEKPTAAALEMEYIDQLSEAQVLEGYDDIARCIARAANTTPIREAEMLRDILLSVAAPALAKLQEGAESDEIVLAMQALGAERAKLFDFRVEKGALSISLVSEILDVPGFPLHVSPGDNVIAKINTALGLDPTPMVRSK